MPRRYEYTTNGLILKIAMTYKGETIATSRIENRSGRETDQKLRLLSCMNWTKDLVLKV